MSVASLKQAIYGSETPMRLSCFPKHHHGIEDGLMRAPLKLFMPLIGVVFAGCASVDIDKWPGYWPSQTLIPTGHCPNLSGLYWNEGESTDLHKAQGERLLSTNLMHYAASEPETQVRIEQSGDEQLTATVLKGETVLRQKTYTRAAGDFTCDNEALWMRPTVQTLKDGTGYGKNWQVSGFNAAGNHSLASVKRMTAAGLIAWVIPMGSKNDVWFHWVNPDTAKSGEFFY